jgi:hypothetical protein
MSYINLSGQSLDETNLRARFGDAFVDRIGESLEEMIQEDEAEAEEDAFYEGLEN